MTALSLTQTIRRWQDQQGIATVEFGILLVPLMFLLMGSMDLGHQFYLRSVAQGALDDASRRASVETPKFSSNGTTLEEKVENMLKDQIRNVAPNAQYIIVQRNYYDFNGVGNPERLVTDNNGNGKFDADDDDCWEDSRENKSYDLDSGSTGIGGANDVAFYSVRIIMPRLFPTASLLGFSKNIDLTVKTAVRNQPYDVQASPAVLCGAGT